MGSSAENGTVHAPQGQPWLTRKAWAGNRIRSHKRWEVIILWGFALAWSALSMPLAYVQIPKALARGETLVACIIGVMLLVAVGLLIGAIRTTRDARRFGDVALQLDPFPGSIGGHFGATTVLPVAYRPGLLFAATLAAWGVAGLALPVLALALLGIGIASWGARQLDHQTGHGSK